MMTVDMPADSAYKTRVLGAPRDDLGIRAESRARRLRVLSVVGDAGRVSTSEIRAALPGQCYISNDVQILVWYKHLRRVGWSGNALVVELGDRGRLALENAEGAG